MKDPRTMCYEHEAKLMALAIAEDLQAMFLHDAVRPLHERLNEYIFLHN